MTTHKVRFEPAGVEITVTEDETVLQAAFRDKIDELQARLPGCRFIPALSEPFPQYNGQGETGLITEVVAQTLSAGSEVDVYLCGPAPMIDAALPLLVRKGIREERMLFDKFTPAGKAG
jgi:propane monooxygenase reductase component